MKRDTSKNGFLVEGEFSFYEIMKGKDLIKRDISILIVNKSDKIMNFKSAGSKKEVILTMDLNGKITFNHT